MNESTKDKVLNALNRIDELACQSAEGDEVEARALAEDYDLVFNYISNETSLSK